MATLAAILPILSTLSQKRPCSPSPHRTVSVPNPVTPSHASIALPLPLSPLPGHGSELRACLSNFAEASRIDITNCEEPIMALELTPDIIPDIPATHLCDVTGVVEGQMQSSRRTVGVGIPALMQRGHSMLTRGGG